MNPSTALRDCLMRVFAVFAPPRHIGDNERSQAAYMTECIQAAMRHVPSSANLETVEIIARNAADSLIQSSERMSWPTPKEMATATKWAAGQATAKQRPVQEQIARQEEPECYIGPGFWPWYAEQRRTAEQTPMGQVVVGLLDGYAERRRKLEAGRLEGWNGRPMPIALAGGYEHHEPRAAE